MTSVPWGKGYEKGGVGKAVPQWQNGPVKRGFIFPILLETGVDEYQAEPPRLAPIHIPFQRANGFVDAALVPKPS